MPGGIYTLRQSSDLTRKIRLSTIVRTGRVCYNKGISNTHRSPPRAAPKRSFMKNYQTFVFDLDGTLADTSPGVFAGVSRTLSLLGREPLPEERLRRFIGPPLHQSFSRDLGMEEEEVRRAVLLFRDYYKSEGLYHSDLYPGMDTLVRTLKQRGCTLVVATLKREEQAITVVEHLGLTDCFSTVIGSDDAEQRTKKDTIDLALELAGITSRETALMIGDSEFDAVGAEQAGVDFCAALYGFGLTPETLENHPCMLAIQSPLELLDKLDRPARKDA